MKASVVIEAIINQYNLSFPTRWRVLEHLFLVNGNACYWKNDGTLEGDSSHYQEGVFFENKTIKSLNEMMELTKDYSIPHITDAYHLKIRFEQGLDAFKQKHYKKIAANQFYFFDSQIPTFDDLSRVSFNYLFNDIPSNIQPDWQALIVETACIVQKGLVTTYLIGEDPLDSSSWSSTAAFNIYMAAQKRLDTLK